VVGHSNPSSSLKPFLSLVSPNSYAVLQQEEAGILKQVDERISKAGRSDSTKANAMVERLPEPESSVEEILSLAASRLIAYLEVYGFEPTTLRPASLSSTLSHWQLCSVDCGWMKFLKYKYAAFMAFHLGGDLPLPPFSVRDHPSMLIGGSAGRFIRKMLRSSEARSFATGILYAKKAAPRASPRDLKKAKLKAFQALTTTHSVPVSQLLVSGRPMCLLDFKQQVHRTCVELCRPSRDGVTPTVSEAVLHHPYAPSIRANYSSRRDTFGTLGSLSRIIPQPEYDDILNLRYTDPELFAEILDDDSFISDPRRGVVEYRDAVTCSDDDCLDDGQDNIKVSKDETIPLVVNPSWAQRFRGLYRDLYEEVRRKSSGQTFNVKLVALAEALKIRVISKGPGLKYFLLKPIQKFLSKLLGKFQCFRLTRQTVNADFLTRFFLSRPTPPTSEVEEWHSLDYEGATDNLNPEVSSSCVDSLCELLKIPPDLSVDFREALVGHIIDFPGRKSDVKDMESAPQAWGQLMGSPMSFVVLCIVNMAAVRHSYELTVGRRVSLFRVPALVNGDDGLVRAPHSFLPIWKDMASLAGLIPSLGKVYSHRTYANINSTSYDWNFEESCFQHIPYVNMGLMFGMQRSAESSNLDDIFSIDSRHASLGSRHHTLIESCPEHLRVPVHIGFMRANHDILHSLGDLPWYIPTKYGGVGLRPIENPLWDGDIDSKQYSYGPKPWEVLAMHYLQDNPTKFHFSQLPTDVPLQVRSTWTSLIPFKNNRNSHISYDMSEDDIGLLDVSTYYIVPSLIVRSLVKDPLKILRRCQKDWKTLSRWFNR
jgi:hypothetical protein